MVQADIDLWYYLMFTKIQKSILDPTWQLLEPIVEFVRWCPYFRLRMINFCTKNFEVVPNKTASCLIYHVGMHCGINISLKKFCVFLCKHYYEAL